MNEKVTVIVPVYNVEKYLTKCLNSLLKQTYQNLEVILVNDGSTDNSRKICEGFVAKYDNFVLINTANHGQSVARNIGLKMANGSYIGFVDSDDYIDEDFYTELVKAIKKTNAAIACTPLTTKQTDEDYQVISSESAICRIMGGDLGTVVWNKLFRAEILRNVSFPVGQVHEEIEFNRLYLQKVHSLVVVQVNEYHYNKSREGNTNSRFEISRLNVFSQLKLFIKDLHQNHKRVAERQVIFFGVIQFMDMYKVAFSNKVDRVVRKKIRKCYFYFFKKFLSINSIKDHPMFFLKCLIFVFAPNYYVKNN